jgi:2-polyprenyl-3-methyl-5-hydroxy-6-metoxy-1,4-benzoquinol methylase
MIKTWSTQYKSEKLNYVKCDLCGGEEFAPFFSCENFSYKRCCACGLVQINPQPEKDSVKSRYGETYLAYETQNEKIFLDLALKSMDDAGIYAIENTLKKNGYPLRLLDIGCATGSLLNYFKQRGWEVCGVEICKEQAEYALEHHDIAVSTLPLEENNFPENYFSVVTASHLIEHLNSPSLLVNEVFRILKTNGHFIVITPNLSGFQAKLFGPKWRSAIFDHLYLFSVKTLSKLLVKTGFSIEKVITWGGLAKGVTGPFIKNIADKAAKKFGFGDVMLFRAVKKQP